MQIHQIKVEQGGKRALLDLNPFFYPEKAVRETASAFKKVCKASFRQENNRILVELLPTKGADCRELSLKFANYALSASREMH